MSFLSAQPGDRVNPYLAHGCSPASFWRRVFATLVDGLAVLIVTAIISRIVDPSAFNVSHTSNSSLLSLTIMIGAIQLAINTAYQVYFVGHAPGRTLGARVAGIQVVSTTAMGTPGYTRSSKRVVINLLNSALGVTALASIAPVIFLVDSFWMLFDRDRQTIHDKIAGTYVIRYVPGA